jgi:hypothetical protein
MALRALPRHAPWRALWATSQDAGRSIRGLCASKGATLAALDLRGDEAARRAALHGKWRNRLRRAEAAGISVTQRPLDIACDAALLRAEIGQRRKRGYDALPAHFTESWARVVPQDSLMTIASEGNAPIAFMLMLLHGDVATYHIGWSGDRGRQLHAHNLLLWRASAILADRGFAWLDLGGAERMRTPGLARFKLGTGAARHVIGPTMLHF